MGARGRSQVERDDIWDVDRWHQDGSLWGNTWYDVL